MERWVFISQSNLANNHLKPEVLSDYLNLLIQFKDTSGFSKLPIFENDTSLLKREFYTALIFNDTSFARNILISKNKNFSKNSILNLSELLSIYELKIPTNLVFTDFETTIKRLNFYRNKNPYKAAILSALIPGLGKIYMHHYSQGFSVFVTNVFSTLPIIEFATKVGLLSFGTLASAILFIPLYVANIYGSFVLKQSEIKKLEIELQHEVLDFCRFQLHN